MEKVRLKRDGDTFYLYQNLKGLDLYQKSKAIERFLKTETKVLENCIDARIREIFAQNGINVYDTDKSVLNRLFDTLKTKGKEIKVIDIYANTEYDNAVVVGVSKNQMTAILEDDYMLSCGIEVKEVES